MNEQNGGQRVDLRQDLLRILRETDARKRISEALVREAAGEGKSTSVIRAYETVRNLVEGREDGDGSGDFSQFTDEELLAMLRESPDPPP